MIKVCDSWIRAQRREDATHSAISLLCATTALAAHNFTSATTAHSLFKIPADDADESDETYVLQSLLMRFPGAKALVDAADFIAWDEFPCAHRMVFEAAYQVTEGFRDKIVLCSGDLRQLTPVVKSSSILHQIDASPVKSKYWTKFDIFNLVDNLRLANDLDYATYISTIGEGRDGSVYERFVADVDISQYVRDVFSHVTIDNAMLFAYPECTNNELSFLNRAKLMATSAILANTNERVSYWNQQVQQLLPLQDPMSYWSSDELCDAHDGDENLSRDMLTTDFLNYCDAADVPAHQVKLRVGDLCILMRNIDKPRGLTNNQRVIIRVLKRFTIGVSIARDHTDTVHWLPKIKFRFVIPGTSFEMVRKQFPLKLAYSFTVHKAQGQELTRVLLDSTTPVFAHGQLYVALSRVRDRQSLGIFTDDEQMQSGSVICRNVVLTEIIQCLL